MNILIIGKYPPIEGGVAAHTYWLARGLGERGHAVSVVTNALRVEEDARLTLDMSDHQAQHEWAPKGVTLHAFKNKPPHHIPFSEAYVTRLANSALGVVATREIDVVYAHYLEPYATAGYLIKQATGLPLVVRHAGSDMYRLLPSADFSLVLGRVLQSADRLILSGRLIHMGLALSIPRRRVVTVPGAALPRQFSPEGAKRDLSFPDTARGIPVIAYLGKAGKLKGIIELIDAVDQMSTEVRLLLVTDGPLLPRIIEKIESSPVLKRRVHRIPFVAPWEVPEILRSVDMLAHLENRFPVPIHTPLQPYEAIACATPLLLSKEMADKLKRAFPAIEDFSVVVEDPRDTAALAHALDTACSDLSALRAKAHELRSQFKNDWDAHLNEYERVFASAKRTTIVRRMLRIFSKSA